MPKICSICERKHSAKGFCRKHYLRWSKHGDPLNAGKTGPRKASFEEYVEYFKRVDPVTGCWNWTGMIDRRYGYAVNNHGGKRGHLHRHLYESVYGQLAKHLAVCHKCDNRRCINPEHMFVGTRADNQRDMKEKGRAPRGERNARAKLTADQVLAIRVDKRQGMAIAKDYGISRRYVYDLRRGDRWAWLVPVAAVAV